MVLNFDCGRLGHMVHVMDGQEVRQGGVNSGVRFVIVLDLGLLVCGDS